MTQPVRKTLVLCGAFRGKTATLKGYPFTNGRLVLEGSEVDVENVSTYLGRCYQAFPEGDPRTAAIDAAYAAEHGGKAPPAIEPPPPGRESAEDKIVPVDKSAEQKARERELDAREAALVEREAALKEAGHGEPDVSTGPEQGSADQVEAEAVQPPGEGAAEVPADDGSGADGDPAGAEGHVPGGDGHKDPRVPAESETPEQGRLRAAIASLDVGNDEHWTDEDGLPALSALETAVGHGAITREAVEAVATNWNRELARGGAETAQV